MVGLLSGGAHRTDEEQPAKDGGQRRKRMRRSQTTMNKTWNQAGEKIDLELEHMVTRKD